MPWATKATALTGTMATITGTTATITGTGTTISVAATTSRRLGRRILSATILSVASCFRGPAAPPVPVRSLAAIATPAPSDRRRQRRVRLMHSSLSHRRRRRRSPQRPAQPRSLYTPSVLSILRLDMLRLQAAPRISQTQAPEISIVALRAAPMKTSATAPATVVALEAPVRAVRPLAGTQAHRSSLSAARRLLIVPTVYIMYIPIRMRPQSSLT
mmetsp:Transcript_2133/g.5080  ORF Transcript_2133/g.5080 Transcript_2133/m.5080 type:complete len:215 (-) Transcript_2133:304-948(-)